MTDMDAIVQNWGRWARTRIPEGHCASIEHRFKNRLRPDMTPTGWGDWIPVVPAPILPPVDALQALEVERTMRHLPDDHRTALKLAYVYRMPRKMICLRLGIAFADFDRYTGDARAMVAALLHRQEKRCKVPIQFNFPAHAEILEPLGSGCIG